MRENTEEQAAPPCTETIARIRDAGRERQRRHRKRQRAGQILVPLIVLDHEIDRLVAAGYLNPVLRHSRVEVAYAVERLLQRWAGPKP